METVILFISIINFNLLSQEVPSGDPGYSTHNYKHPNKAAAAAKRDSTKGIRVSIDETSRDYKKVASKQTESVLKIEPKESNLKRVNYKMPQN